MTLNTTQLCERLVHQHFSDVEQVDKSVIRFTRRLENRPFAIYYVDITSELPDTPEALAGYQERIIGKRYFDGNKSLQWNNYLYFVVSDDLSHSAVVLRAKDVIESDRTYARKRVVAESELDSELHPAVLTPSDAPPDANILSVWSNTLMENGLDEAVLSDALLPNRLSLIESPIKHAKPKTTAPAARGWSGKGPFLRSIGLTQYRAFPTQRSFDFGTVNLISGVNGSGKTSLLEAIELLYCGRNKRNLNVTDPYIITATYDDGSSETAVHTRSAKIFRDRNLTWYGQAEVKTNNLVQSFAQWNFLDTDAAVRLAQSTATIDDDLSRLLIGPEASKAWREIERMQGAVATKLHELRSRANDFKGEMVIIETQLKDAGGITQESDSILNRLEDMIRRPGWPVPATDKKAFVGSLVAALSELETVARQAAALPLADSPVSLDGLNKYTIQIDEICNKTEADILQLDGMLKDERRLADEYRRSQDSLKLALEAGRMVDAGIPTRAEEVRRQRSLVASQSRLLLGFDETISMALANVEGGVSVAQLARSVASERAAGEGALTLAKKENAKFTELRDQSARLAQQLRDIAAQIVRSSSAPDECPLCHTTFGPGELSKHIQLGIDKQVEARAQLLVTQMRQREVDVHAILVAERAATWLVRFCERAEMSPTISVRAAFAQIEAARVALETARQRCDVLEKELLYLESQGISVARMDEVFDKLRKSVSGSADWSKESLDRLLLAFEADRRKHSDALDAQRAAAESLRLAIEARLDIKDSDLQGFRNRLSELRERCTIARSLSDRLADMFKSFPWPGDRPLSELIVQVDSMRKVAAEFQAAIGRERQAKTILAESTKRHEYVEKQLNELAPRIARFVHAETTLNTIRTKHPLTGAVASALKQNRAEIQAVFARIHSPAEFSDLGTNLTTLVRKAGGAEATLGQISTGQRAAFALSIFLGKNAHLNTIPPVLLIDDPIAHVDDLNCLSFLDYLRDVVLSGGRQIFFATANERVASLFERKFDFLGQEKYRKHVLLRNNGD